MTELVEIVDVQISIDNATVTRQGFGTPIFIGLHKVFTEEARTYVSVNGLLSDGFAADSAEVQAATAFFSQDISPPKIKIGRRDSATIASIFVPAVNVKDNTDYTVTINGSTGETFTVNSGAGATAGGIATDLVSAINGGSQPVTATDLTGSFSITADVASVPYSATFSSNLKAVMDPADADNWVDTLTAVRTYDDDWYGLTVHSHLDADIETIAAYVETISRIYGYSSSDPAIKTSADTDIMSILKSYSYSRSFGMYEVDADTQFPECAWMGNRLPSDPGSSTWAFKTLVGQDAEKLTPSQSAFVHGKSGNTYELIAGVNTTLFGTVADGEYIDVIRGVDWIEARMTERLFTLLVKQPKVPYTDAGIASVENEVRAQLTQAVEKGVLAADPEYIVNVPVASEVDNALKVNRVLPPITFTATLAGAIQKITVRGSVSA